MAQSPLVLAPTPSQSGAVLGPNPVYRGTFQQFLPTTGTFFDPSNIVNGTPTLSATGYTAFVMENPATASPLPTQWGYFSWPTKDVFGNIRDVDLFDFMSLIIRVNTTTAPTDVVCGAAVHRGAMAAGSAGGACELQANAGSWMGAHGVSAGAGWTNTGAAATSASTAGAVLQMFVGASGTSARINTYVIDVTDTIIMTANTATAPATVNTSNDFDTITLGVGWLTGVGGAGGTLNIRADLAFWKRTDLFLSPR